MNNSGDNCISYSELIGGFIGRPVGSALNNRVEIHVGTTHALYGGYLIDPGASGNASGNEVVVNAGTINGSIYSAAIGRSGSGSSSGNVTGNTVMIAGGTVRAGTGVNYNNVYGGAIWGTGMTSIGNFSGIQNLHFDLGNAPTDGTAHTLLNLTNAVGEKSLSNINLAVHRSGATQKLEKGDTFTLVENATVGASVSIGDNVTAEGTDGVTRNYTFAIKQDPNDAHKLIATVIKAGLGEQAKSLVEIRTGASAFLNDGGDFLAGTGMSAAQKEARAVTMMSGGAYGLWAGMGGSLRHETGSYVDIKGLESRCRLGA